MKILSNTSSLLMASVAASVIAASAGFADTKSFETMDNKLRHELTEVGVTDVNLSGLTHKQLGELSAVFSEKKDPTAQKQAAERIINSGAVKPVSHAQMLAGIRDNVAANLKGAGIVDVDVQSLPMGTVEKLADVFSTGDQSRHEAAARAILAEAHAGSATKPVSHAQMLAGIRDNVAANLKGAGIFDVDVQSLSMGTVEKLAHVFSSGDQSRHEAEARAILAEGK